MEPHENDPNYIYSKAAMRWIRRASEVGQKLVKEQEKKEPEELVNFIEQLIDDHYGKNHPKWVLYSVFKQEKTKSMLKFFDVEEHGKRFFSFGFFMELLDSFQSAYVDTGASGFSSIVENVESGVEFPKEIKEIMMKRGFEIRSNDDDNEEDDYDDE